MSGTAATVRMYNVGFGDAFVITIPAAGGDRRILIDCGSHLSGPGPTPISAVARRIVEDARDEGGRARFDVVVASHRHFDHIAGFDSPVWAEVEVGEVWLPWTEDPDDAAATRIRNAQGGVAAHLLATAGPGARLAAARDLLANSLSNNAALRTLHHGFRGNPHRRYLPALDPKLATFALDGLSDVLFHVLGPSRDEAVIRDMEPPNDQSYLARLSLGDSGVERLIPFPDVGEHVERRSLDRELKGVDAVAGEKLFDLAVALEDAINGTSLILAIEVGGAVLVFPGDAQWGTWKAALETPRWRPILRRTTFLKVGHHGSHNATPRDLLDGVLPDGLLAMVSVRPIARWPRIPKKELLARLVERMALVARSDDAADAPAPFRRAPDGAYIEVDVPA